MGGYGSGRYRSDAKGEIDHVRFVDVRRWHRDGLLEPRDGPDWSCNFHNWNWKRDGKTVASISFDTKPGQVILKYSHRRPGQDWQSIHQTVMLDYTPCNYGRERPWFLCPSCNQRVAILYINGPPACRLCKNLTYTSQKESDLDRMLRGASKTEKRIPDSGGGLFGGMGEKPKGMHWQTYWRLADRHYHYQSKMLSMVTSKFNLNL